MWQHRRLQSELNNGDYKQTRVAEPIPPRRRKQIRLRTNPFIDAKSGVHGNAIGFEETEDENDNLNNIIIASDIKF